jgi:hypothetical protein
MAQVTCRGWERWILLIEFRSNPPTGTSVAIQGRGWGLIQQPAGKKIALHIEEAM